MRCGGVHISPRMYNSQTACAVTYVLFSTRGWPRILGAWGDQRTLVAARFQVFMLPTNRAPRYPFEMTIRYRAAGSDEWFQGETLNVSDSGVLFRTPTYAPGLEETLDMALGNVVVGAAERRCVPAEDVWSELERAPARSPR